jgi:hypothetical protein
MFTHPILLPNEPAVIRILHLQARDLKAAVIYARTPRQNYDATAGDLLDEAIEQGLRAQRFEITHKHTQYLVAEAERAELLGGLGAHTCLEMEIHFGPLGEWEELTQRHQAGQAFYRYQFATACAILETTRPAAHVAGLVAGCLCFVPYQELTEELMATFRPVMWELDGIAQQ